MNKQYSYSGPLNGGYAIQDKDITFELRDFCESTYEWREFFSANGVTEHREKFLEVFPRWIKQSKLNSISGLNNFPFISQTNGTSEAFQMFMMRHHNRNFKFFKGDFMMHKVASNILGANWEWIFDPHTLTENDAIIISCPFSDLGSEHPMMNETLNVASKLGVPVLIDMAYFGMCQNIYIDLNAECIEEVTFSLGKTFPIIGARAGIRFQRKDHDDPVLFANQHGIVNNFASMIGTFAMEAWGADYIPMKYNLAQIAVCEKLHLEPTKCMIFGLSNQLSHNAWNRGNPKTRLCISKLLEEEYERTEVL